MTLDFITSLYAKLGIMTWPLTFLSVLMIMIILERSLFCLLNMPSKGKALTKALYSHSLTDESRLEQFVTRHEKQKNTLSKGLCMLIKHKDFTKSLREEAVSIWLQAQRRHYVSGLKILNVIGVLSPLIGLLGTVMGLIDMFKGLSNTQTGVSPAVLADGLGLAMSTTAAGLLIALPAIAFAQVFSIWASRRMAKIEFILNHFNLHLAGMSVHDEKTPYAAIEPKRNKVKESAHFINEEVI